MFDLFTPSARAALVEAQAEAAERNRDHIGDVHLLLGLLRDGSDEVAALLAERGATRAAVSAALDDLDGPAVVLVSAPAGGDDEPTPIPYDATAIEAIQAAVAEARQDEARKVTTSHSLLGILSSPASRAVLILTDLGVDVPALAAVLR